LSNFEQEGTHFQRIGNQPNYKIKKEALQGQFLAGEWGGLKQAR